MGVDVFIHAERRTSGGAWERAERIADASEVYGYRMGTPEPIRVPVYDGRNYALHVALVLGVAVGPLGAEEYVAEPVARPRGVPHDAAEETRAAWDESAFGASWATTAELEAFDWDQRMLESATVCVALEPGGEPGAWSVRAGPDGEGWVEAGPRYAAGRGAVLQDFVRLTSRTYREACQDFLGRTLPALRSFGPPDEVRIVFWLS